MKNAVNETGHLTVASPAPANPAVLLPEGIRAGIQTLEKVQASLPWPPPLSEPERLQFRRIGPRTLRSVENSLTAARQHPEALPSGFDLSGFEADVALSLALGDYLASLDEMALRARDVLLTVGTRAAQGATEVQGHLRVVSSRMSHLQSTTERLSFRSGRPRRKEKPALAPAASAAPAATPVAPPAPTAPTAPVSPAPVKPVEPGHADAA
jgi:hypothetical protein